MNPCVFLDRDGVIIVDKGYVHRREDVTLLAGVATSLAVLREQGFLLIVITNQSGIGRGYYNHFDVFAVHRVIQSLLITASAVQLDAIYYCPHLPQDGCHCRKPAPYLLQQAQRDHAVDLARSYFVGDRDSDIECARRGGVQGIKSSLPTATEIILRDGGC